MNSFEFNDHLLKSFARGNTIFLQAKYDHLPEVVNGKQRVIQQSELGELVNIWNDDAHLEGCFFMGFKLEINWGDVRGSYTQHWMEIGCYFFDPTQKIIGGGDSIPCVNGYQDFFRVL